MTSRRKGAACGACDHFYFQERLWALNLGTSCVSLSCDLPSATYGFQASGRKSCFTWRRMELSWGEARDESPDVS